MRYLRYAILAVIGAALILVALANRQPVELQLLPPPLKALLPFSGEVTLPLYLVLYGGVFIGLIIGFIWEWIREYKHRRALRHKEREAKALEKALAKEKSGKESDPLMALVE